MTTKWLCSVLCAAWLLATRVAHAEDPKCLEQAAGSAPAAATPLDLNQASPAELEKLPGIGPAKAQAIIAFRDARGGFTHVNQLLRIKGIGRAMLRKLAPLVTVSAPTRQEATNRVR